MQLQTARPPYVVFETRAVEDRTESIKAGYPVYRDVDYACVTQAGSKDTAEKLASEYLAQLQRRAMETNGEEGQWHRKLADYLRDQYDAWKKGQELPEMGVPIRTSLMFTPAQVKALLNANVRTVEDLAAANEQTLAMIGMGGRQLKDMATNSLNAAKDGGKVAYEMAALKAENADLRTRLEALEKARKPGRPRKEEASLEEAA